MRRWTRPLPAEPDRGILSHVWTTSTCYKPLEIERRWFGASRGPSRPPRRRHGTAVGRGPLQYHARHPRCKRLVQEVFCVRVCALLEPLTIQWSFSTTFRGVL